MSASVMGAVMTSGPTRLRLCLALVGIADNADDFGFAQLSIATIASKARCDQRTAMRVVQSLEREGWLKVYRRVVDGKGSVYIIDIAKLGIVPDQKSRKSQWHVAFERGMKLRCDQEKSPDSGDKMSPESVRKLEVEGKSLTLKGLRELSAEAMRSGDKLSPENAVSPFLPPESGDNSQGVQVTFCLDSGDILRGPIRKNQGTIRNPDNSPLPPSQAKGEHHCHARPAAEAWMLIRACLERSMNRQVFETWITPLRGSHWSGNVLHVSVPSKHFNHVGKTYFDAFERAVNTLEFPVDGIVLEIPETRTEPVIRKEFDRERNIRPRRGSRALVGMYRGG